MSDESVHDAIRAHMPTADDVEAQHEAQTPTPPAPSTSGRLSRVDAPIDFAAVKVEHYPFTWSGPEQTQTCEAGVCHAAIWPCLPYRLADEAERLAGKVARVEALSMEWCGDLTGAIGEGVASSMTNELLFALADNPEQVQP